MLIGLLNGQPQAHDVVTQLLAGSLGTHRLQAHLYDGYWEDVGNITSYHQASLALASDRPPFDFYSPEGIIYTACVICPRRACGQRICSNALLAMAAWCKRAPVWSGAWSGCASRIGRHTKLRDTVMIGADDFENATDHPAEMPALGVGDQCVIERAILDKDCRIGHRVHLVNRRGLENDEGNNYVIRDGIIVIPNGAVVPDGTVI